MKIQYVIVLVIAISAGAFALGMYQGTQSVKPCICNPPACNCPDAVVLRSSSFDAEKLKRFKGTLDVSTTYEGNVTLVSIEGCKDILGDIIGDIKGGIYEDSSKAVRARSVLVAPVDTVTLQKGKGN